MGCRGRGRNEIPRPIPIPLADAGGEVHRIGDAAGIPCSNREGASGDHSGQAAQCGRDFGETENERNAMKANPGGTVSFRLAEPEMTLSEIQVFGAVL